MTEKYLIHLFKEFSCKPWKAGQDTHYKQYGSFFIYDFYEWYPDTGDTRTAYPGIWSSYIRWTLQKRNWILEKDRFIRIDSFILYRLFYIVAYQWYCFIWLYEFWKLWCVQLPTWLTPVQIKLICWWLASFLRWFCSDLLKHYAI